MIDTMEYRNQGGKCLRLAEVEEHPTIKAVLETMARTWLTLAEHLEHPAERPFDDDAGNDNEPLMS